MAERLIMLTLSALVAITAGIWFLVAAPFIFQFLRVDVPSLLVAAIFSLTGWMLWRTWLARRVPTARFLWLLASWAGLGAQLALIGRYFG